MHYSSFIRKWETEAELKQFLGEHWWWKSIIWGLAKSMGPTSVAPWHPWAILLNMPGLSLPPTHQFHSFPQVLCPIPAIIARLMTGSYSQRKQKWLHMNSLNFSSIHLQIAHIHIQSASFPYPLRLALSIMPSSLMYINRTKRLKPNPVATRLSFFLPVSTMLPEESILMAAVVLLISLRLTEVRLVPSSLLTCLRKRSQMASRLLQPTSTFHLNLSCILWKFLL